MPSAPLNCVVSAVAGSPTFLSVSWSTPMPKNGVITLYSIYCNTTGSQPYPEQVIGPNMPTIRSSATATTMSVTFNTALKPYTNYSCYVTANTSVGEGRPSVVVTGRTAEGGEK